MCNSSHGKTHNQYLTLQCNLYRMYKTKEVKVWALVSSVASMVILPDSVRTSHPLLEHEASYDLKGSRTTPMA
jgi:hypothetical protein